MISAVSPSPSYSVIPCFYDQVLQCSIYSVTDEAEAPEASIKQRSGMLRDMEVVHAGMVGLLLALQFCLKEIAKFKRVYLQLEAKNFQICK